MFIQVISFLISKENRVFPNHDTKLWELVREKDPFFHLVIFPPNIYKESIKIKSYPTKRFEKLRGSNNVILFTQFLNHLHTFHLLFSRIFLPFCAQHVILEKVFVSFHFVSYLMITRVDYVLTNCW
jgi:hypothetical protein